MREIKFRVFFYDGVDYSTGEIWDFESAFSENFIEVTKGGLYPTDECSILMQYTGLKDKNDKEIYEGDIIKFHIFTQELGEGFGVYEGEREWIGEIAMESFGVWLESDTEEKSGYIINWYGTHEESIEIIGNIYENPELLR